MPLVYALRWDTGVQVKVGDGGPIEVSGAVTNGTLSSPRFEDDNGGKQISGRVVLASGDRARRSACRARAAIS